MRRHAMLPISSSSKLQYSYIWTCKLELSMSGMWETVISFLSFF